MKVSKSKIANGEFNGWDDESQSHGMIAMVREGISYSDFLSFFRNEPFTDQEWAKYLGISVRTLDRYRTGQKSFPAKQSERILEIKRLLNYGENVFGDGDDFMDWMKTRSIPMGGVIPKEVLDTSIGINMVHDQLGRIEHGILA
ncbi:MAG TPA: antitoxin Xre/MbcA/ParS toxin-binding domain-containing protein [Pricia sp.]|nr:antitoxin Xre/MbcA/ParS toxin-binding domain-containing protein [Pricia sp.]